MATFETIKLDKGLYRSALGFNAELEKIDPSENYKGTSLENLDAFERQLKRFGIKIKGGDSSPLEKFFQTSDSAVLFPEYVSRAVKQGVQESNTVQSIIASCTEINSLDYRSIYSASSNEDKDLAIVYEGSFIPETEIKTKDNLVHLNKRGRMLVASYEALRFQRLDLFTIMLRQIGNYISRSQILDALTVLFNSSVTENHKTDGTLNYNDLITLWDTLDPYTMNTLICSPSSEIDILSLSEMRDSAAGLNFHATGKPITPLGANLIRCKEFGTKAIVALDKNYALEMVTAGGIQTDFDKLIDRQLQRATITQTYGFSTIFNDAAAILTY